MILYHIRALIGFIFLISTIGLQAQTVRLEAEDGTFSGTTIGTAHTGFSGTGYVTDFTNETNDSFSIEFDAEKAGNYKIEIGYSTPFGHKNNYIILDGAQIADQHFPATSDWTELEVGVYNLTAGPHVLKVESFWGFFEVDYFDLVLIVGEPPVAVVEDVFTGDTDNDGMEEISLDGSMSNDPDGNIISFEWILDDEVIGTDEIISHVFSLGSHTVKLTVTDNDDNKSTEQIVIIIADLTNKGLNRLSIRNAQQKKFMSGINIAWSRGSNFARDVTNFVDSDWTQIFDAIEAAGGNACRWWLHTNGAYSPLFNSAGEVTGLNSQEIDNMKKGLDMAYDRGIMISMCLWSFDMLQNNSRYSTSRNRALLEDPNITRTYIDNALIPILESIGNHPAVMSWEIFNEPEGMTELGWADSRTTMAAVQQFVNLTAGAIHREVPTALVSNGSWSFRASTNVGSGNFDFYSDSQLIAAGGDPAGTLDFVQVHYYDHFSTDNSPFHNPASHWGIDKPIVIGEFPADGVLEYSAEECFERAYQLGYAGAMSWSWSDMQFGGFEATSSALTLLKDTYPDDIIILDNTAPGLNQPPLAVMSESENLLITVDNSDVIETLTFDATGSQDPDGESVTFTWKVDYEVVGTDESLTHDFDYGEHFLQLVVTDGEGSRDFASIFVTLWNPLGIEDEIEQLVLYPNPARDYLNLEFSNNRSYDFQIIDMNGREMHFGSYSGSGTNTVYIGGLPQGIYHIRLTDVESYTIKKFVKE
ncbi:MAG: PKD domain-containing protein [Bacteroidetes bacterium]|nr:PKD domain-containing protein [Bacteroidota bacterium]MDA1122179.1 PKD domain-containing protein [Bacteroidota bacterium]